MIFNKTELIIYTPAELTGLFFIKKKKVNDQNELKENK